MLVEVISEMTMLWVSVVMTLLIIAALARASLSSFEWFVQTGWKNQINHVEKQRPVVIPLIRPSIVMYRPKIPGGQDRASVDDEAYSLVVCI